MPDTELDPIAHALSEIEHHASQAQVHLAEILQPVTILHAAGCLPAAAKTLADLLAFMDTWEGAIERMVNPSGKAAASIPPHRLH